MKLICTQENLNKGLNIVSHIASRNVTLPILNNVLLKAENGAIKLVSTNLEIGISAIVRGKIEREGEFTVQARLLADYISLLPKENIELNLEGDNLNIKCSSYKTFIKGLSAGDFPLIPQIEQKDEIKVNAMEFKKALASVIFAVTLDESRPEIGGVYFNFSGPTLTLVGTDSYRLSEKKLVLKQSAGEGKSLILPLKTAQELFRILYDEGDGEISLFVSDNQILFKLSGEVELVSRLVEGQYPDYKQILPEATKTQAKVMVNDFIKVIKSASLFCKPGINDVKVAVSKDKKSVVVASLNSSVGENVVNVDAEISGEDNEAVFNFRYLLDGLNNLDSGEASLELISGNAPGLIKPAGDDSYQYIVMPIRQ